MAAVWALVDGGPSAVAVEPLAASLGTTKGSFYWHFDGRDELIAAALALWEQRATLDVIKELEQIPDPADRLAGLFDMSFGQPDDGLAEAAMSSHSSDPIIGPVLARVARTRVDFLVDIYRELGLSTDEAQARAVTVYATYIGHFQLARTAPDLLGDHDQLRTATQRLLALFLAPT